MTTEKIERFLERKSFYLEYFNCLALCNSVETIRNAITDNLKIFSVSEDEKALVRSTIQLGFHTELNRDTNTLKVKY